MAQQPAHNTSQSPVDPVDVLVAASLFAEDFSIDWLIQLTDLKASTVLEALEEACHKSILKKQHHGQYLFANTRQKTKYRNKLNRAQSDPLHRRIIPILLSELADGEDKARRISVHIQKVKNNLERCRWLAKAGELFRVSNNVEAAVRSYKKLLIDLSGFTGHDANILYIRSVLEYSKIIDIQFDTQNALRFLTEALKRSESSGDLKSAALLNMHIAKHRWYRSQYPSAIKHFNLSWKASIELEDPTLTRSAVTFSTFFHYWQGRFQEAVTIFERDVLGINRVPAGDFPIMASATVGYCYALTGQPAHGIGIIDNALSFSRDRGDSFLTAFCEVVMAITLLNVQRLDEAITYINRSFQNIRQWPKSPVYLFCLLLLSYANYLKDKPQKAITYLSSFLEKREQLKISMWPYPYLLELCWEMELGNLPRIKGVSIDDEIQAAIKGSNAYLAGIAHRFKALMQQKRGASERDILVSLQTSVRWIEKSGHKIEIANTRLALSNHYFTTNHPRKGKESIQKASADLLQYNPGFIPVNLKPLIKAADKTSSLPENLLEFGQRISENESNPDLINHLLKNANQLLGAERGGIFVRKEADNSGSDTFRLLAGQNLRSGQIFDSEFHFSLEAIRTVFETKKGVCHNQSLQSVPSSAHPVQSLICVPILQGRKILGIQYHDNRLLSHAFKPEDFDTLSFCAALAGIIMVSYSQARELLSIKSGSLENQKPAKDQDVGALGMIGTSQEMKKIYSTIEKVAETDSTVLILGETGVGKELVANAVHMTSSRRNEAFIAVNCNALDDNLISSELFGHERGAFTGAHGQRAGRFELAHRGTLFIDEIGEMPLETQVRLLRVLQTKTFERMGGTKTIKSDFRLIVATNRDIEEEVHKGHFRSDLYYRLSTFPVLVPPLRERRADIPLLTRHFVKIFSLSTGKNFVSIPEKEMKKLQHYHWPGNIRELEHVIERGAILSTGLLFKVPELNPAFDRQLPGNKPPGRSLVEIETFHITQTLILTGWRIRGKGGAAEILGLHPSTLYSRLKKLGIRRHGN